MNMQTEGSLRDGDFRVFLHPLPTLSRPAVEGSGVPWVACDLTFRQYLCPL